MLIPVRLQIQIGSQRSVQALPFLSAFIILIYRQFWQQVWLWIRLLFSHQPSLHDQIKGLRNVAYHMQGAGCLLGFRFGAITF